LFSKQKEIRLLCEENCEPNKVPIAKSALWCFHGGLVQENNF